MVDRLHLQAVALVDAVPGRITAALAAAKIQPPEPGGKGDIVQDLVGDMPTEVHGALITVPAKMHGGSPQPFIGIVFQQQAEEALLRI